MASPCYLNSPTGYDKAQCDAVQDNYNNGSFRADQLGVAQQDNWFSERRDPLSLRRRVCLLKLTLFVPKTLLTFSGAASRLAMLKSSCE